MAKPTAPLNLDSGQLAYNQKTCLGNCDILCAANTLVKDHHRNSRSPAAGSRKLLPRGDSCKRFIHFFPDHAECLISGLSKVAFHW